MENTKGKVALITGASSGIGRELAILHASYGGDLVLVARNGEALNKVKEEIESKYQVKVEIILQDLNLPEGPENIYTSVKEKGITIDYLINNAGFGGLGSFHKRDWEADRSMIQVNVMSLAALTRLFLPDFVQRKSGRVLNVSSMAALTPGPFQAVYYATKAFVTSFSNGIAEELRGTGVSVTALMPGATKSQFGQKSGMDKTIAFKKPLQTIKVAQAGYRGMVKGKLNVKVMPFGLRLGLLFLPLLPKSVVLKAISKIQDV
ncbi:SDR family NAD(P)-dependent oxidoreductase [Spirochaeta cellobiosiphila]|uniref:SDR family NAD(P)-dependent oxidoreductase n=1 Tax=Spirochaeta cellobiosiphila TaxID=504483 RepID=UPI000427D15D|nr:SDR family oxidoreductase [Spirochaeta cellobiosiphila]